VGSSANSTQVAIVHEVAALGQKEDKKVKIATASVPMSEIPRGALTAERDRAHG